MATNKSLVNYAVQNIAFASNISDPTPSSKIRNITETVINEIDNFEDYGDRVLNNMYIDTCDASFLDRVGSQEGIQRLRSHTISLNKDTMFVSLKNNGRSTKIKRIPVGYSTQISDTSWITFTESVDLSDLGSNQEKYVSVEIKSDVNSNTIDIPDGSSYSLDSDSEISVHIHSDIYVPIIEESESDYRTRLIFSRNSSKFGSDAAIKAAVASSSLVTDYSIDYSVSPIRVYLYSSVLEYDPEYANTLETYSVNTVKSQLNQRKSAGTSFEVLIPNPVTFKINLKPRVSNPREVDPSFYGLSDFISMMFKFGEELVVDKDLIDVYKKALGIDLDFLDDYNIEIVQTYMNFDYAAENNSITIHKNEYPFLESLNVG